jgi:hypothetical protein
LEGWLWYRSSRGEIDSPIATRKPHDSRPETHTVWNSA